jgi:hypothetical protein
MPKARTKRTVEALPGDRTFNEVRDLVEDAITATLGGPMDGRWLWVRDLTDEWAVYEVEGDPANVGCFKVTYAIADDAKVTLGAAEQVETKTEYVPAAPVTESVHYDGGRVLEAKGTDDAGGRVFRVQIINAGDSDNGRRYPKRVLESAVSLYEGAKAYNRHRTIPELLSSTIDGLVGSYRNPAANATGIEADLHLLPSALHTAEALDATIAAQDAGLPPIVGISHDVQVSGWRTTTEAGRRVQEATGIAHVFSADVVADPAAGGRALRAVAGGITIEPDPQEGPMTIEELLELINGATPEQRAAALEGLGISADDLAKLAANPTGPPPAETTDAELEEAHAAESLAKTSTLGRLLVRTAVADAGLDERLTESIIGELPDRFTEADVTARVASVRRVTEGLELAGLKPGVPDVTVGEEELDKKREKLYQTFCRNWREGYSSLHEAFIDISNYRGNSRDSDFAHLIVRESWATSRFAGRATESVSVSSWGEILGDSITRRMLDLYKVPRYADWRKIATTVPLNDFRTQHRVRMAGFGDLPTVLEGAPYQPLTSATDEEATYAAAKKGGTEDLTWESVKNDDLGAVVRIPENLARAAARTLYKFVFVDLFSSSPTIYDGVALFHASHANTNASQTLGHSGLNTLRQKMRDQTAYGVSDEVLGLTPAWIIVPNELEEIAFELCTSKVGVPATTPGASDVPNLHEGLGYIVVDDLTDANDWFAAADPSVYAGIEVGFLDGREDPELFMQDDPRVGAPFSSDKVMWKIRHVYGGAVVDYRPFQRATN